MKQVKHEGTGVSEKATQFVVFAEQNIHIYITITEVL